MARTAKTPISRALDVAASIDVLPALIKRALNASETHGWNDPRALAAWESVETHGATVHRQARLLAGKSRGG